MTDTLLIVIMFLLIVIIRTIQQQNKKINATLDSLAEMLGDLLRELINKTEGKK
jgi:hypothetical protein